MLVVLHGCGVTSIGCWLVTSFRRMWANSLVDALTKELITVINETTVTAETMCQLLVKLAAHVPDSPITVVLDNARYQHCAVVQAFVQQLEIELLYLPSYSPHLNLIERLWRFVRKECLYSKYYASFPAFATSLGRSPRNPRLWRRCNRHGHSDIALVEAVSSSYNRLYP